MKKLLLIKLAALSAAVSATVGLCSCDMIMPAVTTPGQPTATQTTTSSETETPVSESNTDESEETGETFDPMKANAANIDYKAAKTIAADTTEKKKTYDSSSSDESSVIVNGNKIKVSLTSPVINKSGDTGSDSYSRLFGVNAALLAMGGSNAFVTGGSVTSAGKGAAGVFSYGGFGEQNGTSGDGTTLTINETKISTTGDNAGGLVTTKGGKTTATKLDVTTDGQSSPAVSTANTGEIVNITNGTFTTNGALSPSLYATATVTAKAAEFVSNLSEGVVLNGINSVKLADCNVTANHAKRDGKAKFFSSVLLHQTSSGDTNNGMTSFTMSGGTLVSKKGHVFHITNTSGVINLSGVTIDNRDSEKIILSVSPDGWKGNDNVGIFNVSKTELTGTIQVAKEGKLTVNLCNGSTFTGTFNGSITSADGEQISSEQGIVYVNLGDDCTWTLTEDTYIASFSGNKDNVKLNGHNLFVSGNTSTPTPGPTNKPTGIRRPTPTKKPKKKPTKKPTKKPKPKKKTVVTTTTANKTTP